MEHLKKSSATIVDLVPAIDPNGQVFYTTLDQALLLHLGKALFSLLERIPWKLVLGSGALLVMLASVGQPNQPRRSRRR